MTAMPPALQDLIDDFATMETVEQHEYLLQLSDRFEDVPSHIAQRPFDKDSLNHVQHCESDAYVFMEALPDGGLRFHFAVENPQGVSARALSRILQEVTPNQSLEAIDAIPESLVTTLFGKGISMGKGMGLTGIIQLVKFFAKQHAKEDNKA